MVDNPFSLTYDELLAMDSVEETVTLSCVSNEVGGHLVGNAVWQGVPLTALLERAGVQSGAEQVVGRSGDGFTAGFPVSAATDGRTALVAYAMNGEPLPAEHGYPARLVVAGLYGYVSATKWLTEIELTTWDDVQRLLDDPRLVAGGTDQDPVADRRAEVERRPRRRTAADRGSGVGAEPGHRQGRGAGRRGRLARVRARARGERRHVGAVAVRVGRRARRPHDRRPRHRRRWGAADGRGGAAGPRRRERLAHAATATCADPLRPRQTARHGTAALPDVRERGVLRLARVRALPHPAGDGARSPRVRSSWATPPRSVVCLMRDTWRCNWRPDAPGEVCASCVIVDAGEHAANRLLVPFLSAQRRALKQLTQLGVDGTHRPTRTGRVRRCASRIDPVRPATRRSSATSAGSSRSTSTRPIRPTVSRCGRRSVSSTARRSATSATSSATSYGCATSRRTANGWRRSARSSATSASTTKRALDAHYGGLDDGSWRDRHVSYYAAAHPWEDFAESWAQIMHVHDVVSTGAAWGVIDAPAGSFDPRPWMSAAVTASLAANELARAMGMRDLYPFALSSGARRRIERCWELVHPVAESPTQRPG